jgi:hypothetical protein
MKSKYTLRFKNLLYVLAIVLGGHGYSQPATVSVPMSVGTSVCNSGTQQINYYAYNGTTNAISNAVSPLACIPRLRIGATTFTYTSNVSTISFNPKDTSIYYFYTEYSNKAYCATCGTTPRTFGWKWKAGTCPTSTTPRLDTVKSFTADLLGVAFDANGKGWAIENYGLSPFKVLIRLLDFTTGAVGAADTMAFTGGAQIYNFSSGDIAISPTGQMYFVVNNKLFTPDYLSYGLSASKKITCTYIDTVKAPAVAGVNLVGLTFADGKLVASYNSGAPSYCGMREINPLTGDTSIITQTGTQSASDFASIISGIGASKKLVSVTNVSGNTYDAVYDLFVRNYGNYPVTNVQVQDNLTTINPLGVVSNVSAVLTSNPAGVALNPLYDGNTNTNLLVAAPVQNLVAYPVSQNNFTVRISCRITNISKGVVYNNSAVATANGFVNVALRDVSTNGSSPDLNINDKPDDVGESQPTPFLISVAAQTPPCAALATTLFSQNFGAGTGLTTATPTPVLASGLSLPLDATGYTYSGTQPIPEESFTVTNNANNANTSDYISLTDHTGGVNGRALIVNPDAANTIMYQGGFTSPSGLCPNQQYSIVFYAAFIGNATFKTICDAFGGFQYPKIKIRIRDASTGLIITEASTTDITSTSWMQYGLKFTVPTATSYTSIIFDLINDAPGGCGNALAIDDVQFGTCNPLPVINIQNINSGCLGSSATFKTVLTDPGVITGTPDYQWQVSSDNITWTNIAAAPNSNTYTIASVVAGDVNKYYRAMVASTGNLGNVNCRYPSPAFYLIAGCDIDDDNDGITDLQESGGVDPQNDDDVDGIPNFRDTDYPGFVDTNADGINDNFDTDKDGIINELDLDSDNDGIPDVVEAYGVDANGDGRIDNYTDTDNDGLSQNVDANNTGMPSSGNGLALPDLDGDGIPNYIDLDSDNDGIPDVVEAGGTDANNDGKIDSYTDIDADGFSDNVDGDVGNDGVAENLTNTLLRTGADINSDGKADSYPNKNMDGDGRANPYDLDSDNDGITDVREAGFIDADNNGFSDGIKGSDGWDDTIDALAVLTVRNTDGDAKPDYLDIDADNDGIPDQIEGIATGSYNFPTNLDSDNDGIDNRYDLTPGFGGNGNTPNNQDGDGQPDYIDADTDNDGIADIYEGNDLNLNGQIDDAVVLTGIDTDGDGLDNFFDNNNSSIKGTSLRLGAFGSSGGDGSPGSITTVQRNPLSGCGFERDWRCASFLLDINFLNITANLNGQNVNLSWIVTSNKIVDHFEVERSTNGSTFIKVKAVKGISTVCNATLFNTTDNINGINSSPIYYRIKSVAANGDVKMGPIVTVLQKQNTKVVLSPNPTNSHAKLSITTSHAGIAQVIVYDAIGKQVLNQFQEIKAGSNTFVVDGVEHITKGNYRVQLILNGEVQNMKLIKL